MTRQISKARKVATVAFTSAAAMATTVQAVSADEAKQDLSVSELNAKITELSQQADKIGLKVNVETEKVYDTDSEATKDGQDQVKTLTTAIKQVDEAKKTITRLVEKFQKNGIKFDGVKTLQIDPTNPDDVSKKLADLDKEFKAISQAKVNANKALTDAAQRAKSNNVDIEFKGTKAVPYAQLKTNLDSALAQINKAEQTQKAKEQAYTQAVKDWEKAVADGRAKVESDYQAALTAWNKTVADGQALVDSENEQAMKAWEQTVAEGHAKVEKEYQDALKAWEQTVADGKAQIEQEYQNAVKAWEQTVAQGQAKVEKEYQDAVTAHNKLVADGKAKAESDYQNKLKAWQTTVDAGKAKVEADYQKALKDWQTTVDAGNAKVEADYQKALTQWQATVAEGKAKVENDYQQALKAWEKTVAEGQANVSSKNAEALKAWQATVDAGKAKVEADYQQALKAWEKTVADGQAKVEADYQKALKAWQDTVNAGNAKAEADYQKALAEFNARVQTVKDENAEIAKQNQQIESNFAQSKARLTPESTARQGQDGVYTQTLQGSAQVSTTSTTTTQVKPRSFLIAFDASGSVDGGTRPTLVNSFIPLLEAMKDNEQAQIGFYDINRDTSYFTGGAGDPTRYMTKMMTKAEVQKLYDTYKSMAHGTKWLDAIKKAGLTLDYTGLKPGADGRYAFEDIFEASRNKNNSVAVMQFTDGWEDDETIDTSFADYAKKKATTFMSVVYGGGRSVEEMKRAGHPNIFQFNDLKAHNGFADSPEETKRVVAQIKETTEEKVTTSVSNATGKVTITPKDGVTLVSAELVSPSGKKQALQVANNAVNYTGTLTESGQYTVNYSFKSTKNIDSAVTGTFELTAAATQGKGGGTATFTTKAPVSTTKENLIAPLTTVHVYDYSSSYSGKLKDSLRLSRKIIEANNNPESKHIFQTYPQNYEATYAANVGDNIGTWGVSSKLLTKQEALALIDKLLAINAPSEKNPTYNSYGQYFKGVADAFGNLRYTDSTVANNKADYKMLPFEDIVNRLVKPTDTVSVIQYTDGWMDGRDSNGRITPGTEESIDKTFADWAKTRAKTFMSVINRNQVTNEDTNSEQSLNQMRAVGHPNIYDMTGKDPKVAEQEIIKQFLETATEKIKTTKGENQTVKVSLGGSGVTVTKATLKGPVNKELPITSGSVDFTEKLPDGTYTVEYEATGSGSLASIITIDGKEVVKDAVQLKGGSAGSTAKATKTDNFKSVVMGKLTPEKPEPKDAPTKVPYQAPAKPVKGEYQAPAKPVKGEYKEPIKPQPDGYKAPEKPVKGEFKEPTKPVKGEYKAPDKPVKGEYKEPAKPVKDEFKEPAKPVKGEYKAPEKPVKGEFKEPEKPVKGEFKEPLKPEMKLYKAPEKPVKGEFKEPEKPVAPGKERVELSKLEVVTAKPELDVKEAKQHKLAVKELPKTGDVSGIAGIVGLGSAFTGVATLFGRRKKNKK